MPFLGSVLQGLARLAAVLRKVLSRRREASPGCSATCFSSGADSPWRTEIPLPSKSQTDRSFPPLKTCLKACPWQWILFYFELGEYGIVCHTTLVYFGMKSIPINFTINPSQDHPITHPLIHLFPPIPHKLWHPSSFPRKQK